MQPVLPEISITKMATAPTEQEPPKVVKAPKKPKIKKKGKKKASPKQAKSKSPETSTEIEKVEVKVDPKNKKEVCYIDLSNMGLSKLRIF